MEELQQLRGDLSTDRRITLDERGKKLAQQRKDLQLFRSPLRTLYYFFGSLSSGAVKGSIWLINNKITFYFVLPTLASYLAFKLSGNEDGRIQYLEDLAQYAVWWIGLGVLSSIGLGTGVHSGLLFLFPHILKVCLAAEECGHLNFSIHHDTWWNSDGFHCGERASGHVPFWSLLLKVLPSAVLWGTGTAMGEIPPYAVSFHATKAGQKNEEIDALFKVRERQAGDSIVTKVVDLMKAWMLRFVERNGFWGIFLLAAWPNALFDLCGICCGKFEVPFWQFFGATFCGKALVKVNMQAVVLVSVFRQASRERIMEYVEWCLPDRIPILWDRLGYTDTPAQVLHRFVVNKIKGFQAGVALRQSVTHHSNRWLYQRLADNFRSLEAFKAWAWGYVPVIGGTSLWSLIIFVAIAGFVKESIEQFARAHASKSHDRQLVKLASELKSEVVDSS